MSEPRKHKWERIGIIASIIAVIGTLGFSVWDKIDYKKQIERNMKQIERTSYDKLYSDASKGLLNSTKLVNAIDRIIENGDDLSGMDLSEKWLPELKLPDNLNMYRIILSNAYLPKSILKFANLQEAKLLKANLQEANLQEADLYGANLGEAILEGANLKGANLVGAYLREANLGEANLERADLGNANLESANLEEAMLKEANLEGVNLKGADLKRANLYGASLEGAKLEGANLRGANLEGADLYGAKLEGANLGGANLEGAQNVTIEQLAKVKTLSEAILNPELMEQVKMLYPHLLEAPKPEEPNMYLPTM